jgi:hypothetical protein
LRSADTSTNRPEKNVDIKPWSDYFNAYALSRPALRQHLHNQLP